MRRSRILSALGLAALLFTGAAPQTESRPLEIYFIDVMGGAATLIVTPERESILIDSGWPGLKDRDPKRIEHVLKNVAKLDKIDHMVTTHWHTDHYGGIEGLSKLVPIGRFWDRGLPDLTRKDGDRENFPDGPSATDPLGVAYRKASEGKRTTLKVGERLPLKGSIEALVVAASGQTLQSSDAPENPLAKSAPADLPRDTSDNAKSLSIRFKLGKFGFLDCGDLTWNIEKALVVPRNQIGQIDLYQVTHHGMDISNHPTLVQSIEPVVAIMNNGPRKGGSPKTVELIRSIPSIQAAYQLHKNASTNASQNTEAARIANSTREGGEFIKATVAPDGSSFTVQIGVDGTPARFESR